MDQPGVPPEETQQALRELEMINKLLGGYHVVLDALDQLEWKKPMTIMDLGCGGGDMLRAIAAWAEIKKHDVNLIGVDMNPVMTQFASEQSKQYPNIVYKTMNVFDDELLLKKVDISMNSLFCHHFDNSELIGLISRMNQLSAVAVIINDLHRHPIAYYSIKILTAIFSKTHLVKYDGPISVLRALTRKEWQNVLAAAGITQYKLGWMWAWRWQIIIRK